jgi:misacylated tRNA(Ala) deacylase
MTMAAPVTALRFRDDAYLRSCESTVIAADERGIQLDATVFYFTSGGQPGDAGTLACGDGRVITILDTVKGDSPGQVIHVPAPGGLLPAAGARVTATIDWDRRHRHMRLHTCMHLLCAAVRAPVSGGQIHGDRARLDFDLQGGQLDAAQIEARLNELAAAGHAVGTRWISDEELAANPELVRTMSVRPPVGAGVVRLVDIPGVDLQACGGTHVRDTSEIGRVKVLEILSKGKRNRRVIIGFAGH